MNPELISSFIIFLGVAIALIAAVLAFIYQVSPKARRLFSLIRHEINPIISPTAGSGWNDIGTFNPAAVEDDQGNVHIVYRAIGADGVSRFGYAVSSDGKNIDDNLPYPIFAMQSPRSGGPQRFDPVLYPSGGSWGGCEDPRMVRIDGRIYMTFNAFDGWDYIRIAAMYINEKDFFDRKWKWSRPIIISPPKQRHKNWVLFPEKINGKFAILHSIAPEIGIELIDSLDHLGEDVGRTISSWEGPRVDLPPRDTWDTWLRSPGPPPIKTKKGWLLLYHAIDKTDPHKYKLGAMLLDLNYPKKVIAKSPGPILFSGTWYENDWKAGIVYACGAVVKGDNLLVYYGGGDKHVCVAHTPVNDLLNWMIPV